MGTWQVDLRGPADQLPAWISSLFISNRHGLGLKFTKRRALAGKTGTRLLAGMVITIEPGAYVEGLGGIRIEDTVLVTKNGCGALTPTSRS